MHAHMLTPDTLIVGESPTIECTWIESGQQYCSSNSHTHTHTHTLTLTPATVLRDRLDRGKTGIVLHTHSVILFTFRLLPHSHTHTQHTAMGPLGEHTHTYSRYTHGWRFCIITQHPILLIYPPRQRTHTHNHNTCHLPQGTYTLTDYAHSHKA